MLDTPPPSELEIREYRRERASVTQYCNSLKRLQTYWRTPGNLLEPHMPEDELVQLYLQLKTVYSRLQTELDHFDVLIVKFERHLENLEGSDTAPPVRDSDLMPEDS